MKKCSILLQTLSVTRFGSISKDLNSVKSLTHSLHNHVQFLQPREIHEHLQYFRHLSLIVVYLFWFHHSHILQILFHVSYLLHNLKKKRNEGSMDDQMRVRLWNRALQVCFVIFLKKEQFSVFSNS